ADYWVEHLVQPVRYLDAVLQAWMAGGRTFVEMGPKDELSRLAREILTPLTADSRGAGMDVEECEVIPSL
ncbi:hypothetical protein B484DRAFT_407813, partial [Ochromonadaceae sp. CCMP2298]